MFGVVRWPAAAAAANKPVAHWEYKTEVNCLEGGDTGCNISAAACDNGQFQARVLRRMVRPDGKPFTDETGSWAFWGLTCFPDQLPGNRLPTIAQIQQQPLAGAQRADLDLLPQRKAERHAVGIAARGGEIFRRARRDPVDGNADRLLETHNEDAARCGGLRFDLGGQPHDEAAIASGGDDARLAANHRRLRQSRR